jgi:hypothetical protein
METMFVSRGPGKEVLRIDPSLFKLHRYLLIFSHARSYSTLLCHVLGSHRQISGYTETMLPYETAADLYRLNAMAGEAGNYRDDCEYVLDKLLYDYLPVSDEVLGLPRVIPIFLVREPEPTIASLTRMRIHEHEQGLQEWAEGTDRRAVARRAAAYYVKRLDMLQGLCTRVEALGRRGIFLPAETLLDDTAGTFRLLERELGLSEPLREEYAIFEKTGMPNSGDTSATIRTGRIVRERSEQDPAEVPIPTDLLVNVRDAYKACMAFLGASPALSQAGPASQLPSMVVSRRPA